MSRVQQGMAMAGRRDEERMSGSDGDRGQRGDDNVRSRVGNYLNLRQDNATRKETSYARDAGAPSRTEGAWWPPAVLLIGPAPFAQAALWRAQRSRSS